VPPPPVRRGGNVRHQRTKFNRRAPRPGDRQVPQRSGRRAWHRGGAFLLSVFYDVRSRTLLCLAAASATACGASINAVYEGDVRFEHCMALDSLADVKPTLRRACWDEWLQFCTFGQTRDRVEYAALRARQLSHASDFDEGEWTPPSSRAPAVPEPTSALAPPPRLLAADVAAPAEAKAADADPNAPGGTSGNAASPGAAPAASNATQDAAPPGAECSASCETGWKECRDDCKSAACEKGCSGKYARCMRRCF
jgi:hypothetical protein